MLPPETYIKRQGTQHGCLPSLLGDGEQGIKIAYGEEKYILGRLEPPRQNKNLLFRYDMPNKPAKKRPLSFVLFESPLQGPPLSSLSGYHPMRAGVESSVQGEKENVNGKGGQVDIPANVGWAGSGDGNIPKCHEGVLQICSDIWPMMVWEQLAGTVSRVW